MKRISLIISLFFLAACAPPQAGVLPTETPIPSTNTPVPTQTSTPTKTPLPSPTPTPEPYLLEDGVLLDWDESLEEYITVAEGIEGLSTTSEGVILALDGDGIPRFLIVEYAWVEISNLEGAENYKEFTVPDRYVSVVNKDGIVEDVLESGAKVLVNPETGIYEYEFKNGQVVKYEPRVMVVKKDGVEVPKEVVETAAETMKNAEMFKRMENGEMVELKTGLEERWSESNHGGIDYIHWYGILCGDDFIGVEMNSGDILLIQMRFDKVAHDFSSSSMIFENGIAPDVDYEGHIEYMGQLGREVALRQIAIAASKSPIGTPFYFTSSIGSDDIKVEKTKVWEAMKTGEFLGSTGSSYWTFGNIGASSIFWDLAVIQDGWQ